MHCYPQILERRLPYFLRSELADFTKPNADGTYNGSKIKGVPDPDCPDKSKKLNIDFICRGGYVVLPPSKFVQIQDRNSPPLHGIYTMYSDDGPAKQLPGELAGLARFHLVKFVERERQAKMEDCPDIMAIVDPALPSDPLE